MCVEGRVRTWSLADGKEGVTLASRLHDNGPPVAPAFSPDGKLLASASEQGWPELGWWVAIHDANTGEAVRTLVKGGRCPRRPGHNCLAFSPDGRTLALGWKEPMVRLWDAITGEELPPLPGRAEDIDAVAFSPDGLALAVGHNQAARGELWLWGLAPRKQRGSFKGPVAAVAFSPDGRLLATVGGDSRLRLCDAKGRLLAAFRWHQCDIDAVAFSPGGQWLATGGKEDRVKLWPVDRLLAARAKQPGGRGGKGKRR
jgi:WD40 repeat protein